MTKYRGETREAFIGVPDVRFIKVDDEEYLQYCKEISLQTRNRISGVERQPQDIVSWAAESAFRTLLGKVLPIQHERILRADVVYSGHRRPVPFYLEIDAVARYDEGLLIFEVKTGRAKLLRTARAQLQRAERIAAGRLGPLRLVTVLVMPEAHPVAGTDEWPRIRFGDLTQEALPKQSVLFISVEDLIPLFSSSQQLALREVQRLYAIPREANRLEGEGEIAAAAALRATGQVVARRDGTLVIDDGGAYFCGGQPAPWVHRELRGVLAPRTALPIEGDEEARHGEGDGVDLDRSGQTHEKGSGLPDG